MMVPSDRFGAELRQRRTLANISLTQLARQVHYDKGHLSKVERGVRPASMALARICDSVLNAGGALRDLVPGLPSAWTPDSLTGSGPRAAGRSIESVFDLLGDRDDVGAESTVGELAGTALRVAAADAEAPDRFRALFDLLRGHGRQAPPGQIFPTALTQARILCRLAGAAPRPLHARLLTLAAHYAEYAGWMAQEADAENRAIRLTAAASLLATRADAPHLVPYTLVRYAELALYRGEARRAVALAERAGRDRSATPRVRILAAQRAAQGYALTGAADACEAALDRAAGLDEERGPVPDDEIWLGSVAAGQADRLIRGWCYYDLGRPDQAAELLAKALAGMPPDALRARTLYGVRLCLARAAAGDVEGACVLADEALTPARLVGSATVGHQLRALEKVLTRWRQRSYVRHVQARMIGLLTPVSA